MTTLTPEQARTSAPERPAEATIDEQLAYLKYLQAVRAATTSADAFTELVIKTETGDPCEVDEIHRTMTAFIEYCWRDGFYCGILAPFGHGKTTHCIMGRTLFEIGKDTNTRIKVISATDDIALQRVSAIKRYIQLDPTYKDVFPLVVPGNLQQWNMHRFYVNRRSMAIDPTLEAKGLFEGGTGGRADFLFFDDVIDYNNTLKQKALMPLAFDAINSVWLKRKESWSRVLSIGTAWHTQDAYHKLRKVRDRWRWLIMGISQDFTRIDCVVE